MSTYKYGFMYVLFHDWTALVTFYVSGLPSCATSDNKWVVVNLYAVAYPYTSLPDVLLAFGCRVNFSLWFWCLCTEGWLIVWSCFWFVGLDLALIYFDLSSTIPKPAPIKAQGNHLDALATGTALLVWSVWLLIAWHKLLSLCWLKDSLFKPQVVNLHQT